jgi:hypothetical protein
MSVLVIDGFEFIQINKHQGHARLCALGPRQSLTQPVIEKPPIRQMGQGIIERELLNLLLQPLTFSNVPTDAQNAHKSTSLLPYLIADDATHGRATDRSYATSPREDGTSHSTYTRADGCTLFPFSHARACAQAKNCGG